MPVRTIPCAGNNERTARRMTQHHVSMRKDVWTEGIVPTLSIEKLLATPSHPASSRVSLLSEDNRVAGRRWMALCHQEHMGRRFRPRSKRRQVADQPVDGRTRGHPRTGERRITPALHPEAPGVSGKTKAPEGQQGPAPADLRYRTTVVYDWGVSWSQKS